MIVIATLQPKQIMGFFSHPPNRRSKVSLRFVAPDRAQIFITDMIVAGKRSRYVAAAGGLCSEWFDKYRRDGVDLGCANRDEQLEIEVQNRATVEQEIQIEFIWTPVLRLVSP